MKLFAASFDVVILRYFLTMFLALGAFLSGMPWLAILCLPVVLLAIMGIKINVKGQKASANARIRPYENSGMEEAA